MAEDCGSNCLVEGGFLTHDPNVGGNAVLLAAYSLLTPVTFYLGYRFRTSGFSAILATGLLLEVLGCTGRLLLHGDHSHPGYFALMLLGTVLGPAFMSSAVFIVLPHILAVYGEDFSPCQPIITAFVLQALFITGLITQVIGIVFMAYGYGGIIRSQSAYIIAGGLGVQTVALLTSAGLYVYFILGLGSGGDAPDPKHSDAYLSTRFSRFLRCMEASTILLLGYSIYRIVEMASNLHNGLFQSQPAFMVVVGSVPLLACALMTIGHPGVTFGSSWATTSPRRLKRHVPPPLNQPFGYATHHRYDPNIRMQFSPSTQRPLRDSRPPPTYGSYGLPTSPKPSSKPPSPMIPSPISVRTFSSRRLSDRSEKRAQKDRGQ